MRRSLKFIALASSGVLSAAIGFSTRSDNQLGILFAAAGGASPEVLRSGLANEIKEWHKNWDFREPSTGTRSNRQNKYDVPSLADRYSEDDKATSRPNATRHLLFIRHGQYVTADKDEKKILTDLGRQQAKVTGQRLKSLHSHNCKIDKIVISTMVRAKETGEIIRKSLPGVEHEYCDFIREGAPCLPEPPSSAWKPEQQEVFEESARIEAAFRKYIHRAEPGQLNDSHEVFVCHANVIRYFVCRALQFPVEGWLRLSIANCGITWLTIKPNGAVVLRSLSDTGHLPENMITRS